MDNWLFALQLGLVSAVVVLIAGWTVSYVLRSARAGAPPVIRASFKELQKGWYQVQIAVANRAPYEVIVDACNGLAAPLRGQRPGGHQLGVGPARRGRASPPLSLHRAPPTVSAG
jgi:hypothetical protein